VHLQFLGHPISNDPIYSNRRVFGPSLGKNDSTPDLDNEIIDRLMAMGRTELPETVSYRTHFTTPPVVPPGTDSSVVEAIMSKEHDAAVERYHKRKGEKLSGQTCDVCGTELYTDPGVHELGIFLHAVAYAAQDGEWKYRSKMPSWALPPSGLEGPREVPGWEDVKEGEEEVVLGDGTVPDIGGDEDGAGTSTDNGKDRMTALVEGVGLVDISPARQALEQESAAAAAANGV
jgi:tRNA pseudouridine synthase 9